MVSRDSEGVAVVEVLADSPASRAGLRPRDVILEFNGAAVKTVSDVLAEIGFDDRQRIPLKISRPSALGATTHHLEIVSDSEADPH